MEVVQPADLACPYCGEKLQMLLDLSVDRQDYIEDCQVCCRPIEVSVSVGPAGGFAVRARREDET